MLSGQLVPHLGSPVHLTRLHYPLLASVTACRFPERRAAVQHVGSWSRRSSSRRDTRQHNSDMAVMLSVAASLGQDIPPIRTRYSRGSSSARPSIPGAICQSCADFRPQKSTATRCVNVMSKCLTESLCHLAMQPYRGGPYSIENIPALALS